MSKVTVDPVTTRKQQKQFIQLPWTLYRDEPNWIPPLLQEERGLLNYAHHPFYERNEIQTFLAYRDGKICGRIAAILNRVHIEYQNEQRGFFGFFECIDDEEVSTALFDAAKAWLANHDVHCMRGPTNPGLNYTWGTLVDTFDQPPTFMMTYNHHYYPRLIESYGFRQAQDLFAFYGYRHMLPERRGKLEPIADVIRKRFDIQLRTLDKSRFVPEVQLFLELYNQSMAKHWSFSPMSPAEVRHSAKGLRHLLVPEVTAVAEVDGRVIGAAFCLPDYNPIIKKINGRLFPFGVFRLLYARRRTNRIRVVSANVLPEYQKGVGIVLLKQVLENGLELPANEVECSWVAESNRLSRGALENAAADNSRTYRMYDWDPDPSEE
ncbi:MAG TPA: N-acetyltransferase [Planctomycetaceae bacterium]|nr:N-acetyltransferase [Blastopirellula sp.]HAY79341.1 N-acetyltransferase [Planctomycetaceae bacterium]